MPNNFDSRTTVIKSGEEKVLYTIDSSDTKKAVIYGLVVANTHLSLNAYVSIKLNNNYLAKSYFLPNSSLDLTKATDLVLDYKPIFSYPNKITVLPGQSLSILVYSEGDSAGEILHFPWLTESPTLQVTADVHLSILEIIP